MKMKAQIKQQNAGAAQRPLGSWLACQLGEKDVEGSGRDRGFMSRLTILMMVMVMRRMMRRGIMLMMGRKRKGRRGACGLDVDTRDMSLDPCSCDAPDLRSRTVRVSRCLNVPSTGKSIFCGTWFGEIPLYRCLPLLPHFA